MRTTVTIIIAAFVLFFSACISRNIKKEPIVLSDAQGIRLYDDVIPRSYELTLWADPNTDGFTGEVAIDVKLQKERRDILINSQNIDISSIQITHGDERANGVISQIDTDGLARISFDRMLSAGDYQLKISYRGYYQKDLLGLYRVKEGDDNYLYTQFEPLSARKMLPCFDNPLYKTPFSIRVVTSKGNTVIANTPLHKISSLDDKNIHEFSKSKPLPTYLLALAIGPFDVVTAKDVRPNEYRTKALPFRGIATKGKGKKLELAMKETPKILSQLETYFQMAYPYEKLDIIAVPDFLAGAMENPGAVTFREWFLLMNEKTASVTQKHGFYTVMAHELAHMWFGDLVTMKWWDDLWLNESFATWLSYKITDEIKPEYKSAMHLLERAHNAMAQDSLISARKIHEPIRSNHDIHNAFDAITYAKGGAVLNMLEGYLGPDRFRQAVIHHLKRFAHGGATSQDFLESLAKFSDSSLIQSAHTFLDQTGVPNIDMAYECTKDGFRLSLKQERYIPIGSKIAKNSSWSLPLCINYESNGSIKRSCFTIDKQAQYVDMANEKCPTFISPNAKGQGYYRYSLKMADWKNLLRAQKRLTEGDRVAMADSLVAGLHAGTLGFDFVATSLKEMLDNDSATLAAYFIDLIQEAHDFWVDEPNKTRLHAFAKNALMPRYEALAHKDDLSAEQRLLKRNVTRFLARTVKDNRAIEELSSVGTKYLGFALKGGPKTSAPDEDAIDDALAIALRQQNDDQVAKAISILKDETDTLVRKPLLFGLSQSRTGHKADAIRRLAFNDNLRINEKLGLFYQHLNNPDNQPMTWTFLQNNFSEFEKILTKTRMGSLPHLAQGLCSDQYAHDVFTYFSPMIKDFEGGPRTLSSVVEGIEICSARKRNTAAATNQFLSAQPRDTVSVVIP